MRYQVVITEWGALPDEKEFVDELEEAVMAAGEWAAHLILIHKAVDATEENIIKSFGLSELEILVIDRQTDKIVYRNSFK